nr:hypothetical protein [Methylobacterium sp. GC_Met_2]
MVVIQITARATRTIDHTRPLYAAIAGNPAHNPGVSPGTCSSIWSRSHRKTGHSATDLCSTGRPCNGGQA